MDKYVGKKLDGRYEIKELIGYGGMAIVFRAYDLAQNREVAIKVLKDEFLDNEEFKRRFRNESKAISLLNHPNVVNVYDVGFGERSQYIVMEYIDGITLKEYIRQQHIVRWKEVVHFTVQILRALQVAHDNGIVHRDVKPQNIMLLRDGSIKVMDFGIARFERDNNKTIADKALGSVHYISPEQARGDITDPRADIYSVGIMMYEMLTGQVPFDGDTPVGIAIQHMQNQADLVRTINKEIPIGLEEIVNRAMQKDIDFRYQTASEMLKDIEELKADPNVIFGYRYLNEDGTTKGLEAVAVPVDGDDEPKKKSYVMPILAGIATTCVIVAIVAIFMFLKGMSNKADDIVLESLVGMTLDEAQIKYPELNYKVVEEVMSSKYKKGMIIETTPKAGTTIKEDADIKVILSVGNVTTTMIDVVGKKEAEAKEMLIKEGIPSSLIKVTQKVDLTTPKGTVLSTNPVAGSKIKADQQVTLVVSLGKSGALVKVPDVLGKQESEASDILVGQKLTPIVERENSDKPKGEVIRQSPKGGEEVEEREKVTITVSTGIAPKKTVTVFAPMPTPAVKGSYTFTGYLDGEAYGSKTITPSSSKGISFAVTGSGDKKASFVIRVSINGSNKDYASFEIDFVAGTAKQIGSTELSLLRGEEEEKSIGVNVSLGGNSNKAYTFKSYLNGTYIGSNTVNPSQSNGFMVNAKGKSGTGKLTVNVVIGGAEKPYSSYNVNFDSGSYNLTSGPNTGLLTESSSSSSSKPPSSSEQTSTSIPSSSEPSSSQPPSSSEPEPSSSTMVNSSEPHSSSEINEVDFPDIIDDLH